MSLQRLMPLIVALMLLSLVVSMRAAVAGERQVVCLALATFPVLAVMTAGFVNLTHWRRARAGVNEADQVAAARRNARLLALAYAWGGLAMYGLYVVRVSGLRWQHGWQYGLAMGLLALLVFLFAHYLGDARKRARLLALAMPLAAAQSLFAAGAFLFLATSGKLATRRPDWAANYIFLFLALAVMLITAMALKTQARLSRS